MQLPEIRWQTTHNVALDKAGHLYVIHEGRANLKDHPSIFVFDSKGKFVRAFGNQFQGGGHGIEVREEDGTEYLYVCAYQNIKSLLPSSHSRERPFGEKYAPMDSGVYRKDEDKVRVKRWGRDAFMPLASHFSTMEAFCWPTDTVPSAFTDTTKMEIGFLMAVRKR